jgi:hypothetical protein
MRGHGLVVPFHHPSRVDRCIGYLEVRGVQVNETTPAWSGYSSKGCRRRLEPVRQVLGQKRLSHRRRTNHVVSFTRLPLASSADHFEALLLWNITMAEAEI